MQETTPLLDIAISGFSSPDLKSSLLQSFSQQYLRAARLVSRAPSSKGSLPADEPKELPADRLEAIAARIREKTGEEEFKSANLRILWRDLDRNFKAELEKVRGSVTRFFEERAPKWNEIGRLCINIAEAPADAELPFALMWSYIRGLSENGEPEHRPLREALSEFGTSAQYLQLLGLLSAVHEASVRNPWIAESKKSGGVFGVELLGAKQAYDLLTSEPQLNGLGISIRTPANWKGLSLIRPSLTAVIGQNEASYLTADTLLDFDLAVTLGGDRLTEAEVASLLTSTEELKFLRGHWVTVDQENIERITRQLEKVKQASSGITLPEATRLLAGMDTEEHKQERVWEGVEAGPGLMKLLDDLRHPERLKKLKAPEGFKGTLRPYQKLGVQWLHFMTNLGLGACLADDMGLGKTVQLITLILALKEEPKKGGRNPHIVIAPASVLTNWEKELERFGPSLKFKVLHSAGAADFTRSGSAEKDLKGLDLVVTTYGMLLELQSLRNAEWDLVILDEAQAIKNPRTQQAKAAKLLKARARIILTGTPVENHSTDLWSLFDFLNPGLLGSQRQFHSFYKRCASQGDLSPLRILVKPYILRRLKTDPEIGKYLPQKNEKDPIYCRLTPTQALLYQQQRDALATELKESSGMQRRGIVLKYIMRFRQICNAPEHWQGAKRWRSENSGKLKELLKVAESCNSSNRKMLVFTAFAEAVRPLAAQLEQVFGTRGEILDGSIPTAARAKIWTHFQEDPKVKFFVLTIGTGGAGLNLSAASVVVHYDRWWNPAKESQATDRAHRFGQKNDVDVYRLISKGTIEERMHELISSKQALFEELFEVDDPIRITEMSNEEILALVSLDLGQVAESSVDKTEKAVA